MATIIKRGSRYRVQIRRKGHPTQSETFASKADARAWAKQVEGRIDAKASNHHPVIPTEPEPAKAPITLGQALERYLREITPTKKGAKQERNRIRAWLRDPLASHSLSDIRRPQLAQWRDQRLAEGKAPSTVRNALTVISHLYAVAASEWEGLAELTNPVQGLRRPKHRQGRDRRLECRKEEARLLKGCDACGSASLRPVVLWALETAMRQGEILALKRSDIRGSIARVADSKNGHSRAIALSSRAQKLISKRSGDPDSLLFPIGQDSLEYYWRKACGLARIKDLHFHDLRHEAVSRLFEKGLTAEEVMGMSGHRTYAMLARYTHLRPSSLADKLG